MEYFENVLVPNNQCDLEKSNAEPEFIACHVEDSEQAIHNIKQELCDNYEDDNCDNTVVTHDNFANADSRLKEESNTLCCDMCGGDYTLYCSKCPMLIRIFDTNIPNDVEYRIKQTMPKDLFDIREITPGAIGIIALRAVPQGVTIGPFEGLIFIIEENTAKWKITKGKLVCLEDPQCLNWMQYIRYSDKLHLRNLMPFQCKDQLFYQSTRLIEEGEELLVFFDNGNANDDSYIQLPIIKQEFEDVYACTFCCLGFSSITFLSKHNTMCQGKKNKKAYLNDSTITQCPFCNIYLLAKEYVQFHLEPCRKRKPDCRLTDNILESGAETVGDGEEGESEEEDEPMIDEHILTRGNCEPESPMLENYKPGAKRFKCSQCPYETNVRKCLNRHGYVHAPEKPFKCGACGRGYTCRNALRTHMRTVHPEIASQCMLCKFQSDDRRQLQEHMKLAHAHKCETCGYVTNVRSRYNQHVLIHTGVRNFQCGHCEKRFTCKSNLKLHIDSIHNTTKRFSCADCDYQTNRKDSFQQHVLVHGGDADRFRCELCDLGFRRQSEFKRHEEQYHISGEGKYECSVCFVEFERRSALVKHSRIVHASDAERFLCSVCGYVADRKKDLDGHQASVHPKEQKPFECAVCDVGFARLASLKTHNKRKHPNGVKVEVSRIKEEIMD